MTLHICIHIYTNNQSRHTDYNMYDIIPVNIPSEVIIDISFSLIDQLFACSIYKHVIDKNFHLFSHYISIVLL